MTGMSITAETGGCPIDHSQLTKHTQNRVQSRIPILSKDSTDNFQQYLEFYSEGTPPISLDRQLSGHR